MQTLTLIRIKKHYAPCPAEKISSQHHKVLAFTLIELLVVVAIITLLVSMLMPALAQAKERSRRVACRSNVHQFIIGIQSYTVSNNHTFPNGLSDSGPDEHTPVLSRATHKIMTGFLGGYKTMQCPWLGAPFNKPGGWYYSGYGYVIGYNYLGGHQGTPWVGTGYTPWKSPQKSTEPSNQPLVTELNAWTPGEHRTFAPHGKRGPILKYNQINSGGGIPSKQVGAVGGNIGLMDGSASWKDINDMKLRKASHMQLQGCYAAW